MAADASLGPRGSRAEETRSGSALHEVRIALERAFEVGRSEYESLALDFETFCEDTTLRVERRLRRAGVEPSEARMRTEIERLRGADLFLALACEHRIEEGWQILLDRFLPRLRRLMLHRGVASRDAEDVLASLPGDLLEAPPTRDDAMTRIGTYDGCGDLFYWLATFAFRRHADAARRAKATVSLDHDAEAVGPDSQAADPTRRASAQETCDRIRAAVRAAWRELSSRHLLILRFKFLSSRTQKQVARLLGISEATVSALAREAVEKTRAALVDALSDEHEQAWPDAGRMWHAISSALEESSPTADSSADDRTGTDPDQ